MEAYPIVLQFNSLFAVDIGDVLDRLQLFADIVLIYGSVIGIVL